MMRLVFVGPPGSGKGTQAAAVSAAHGIPHISTGLMLRSAIATGSPLGRRVERSLDDGHLVPDELIIDVVRDRLAEPDVARGFLLDGFPRTVAQAQALDRLLAESSAGLTHVLEFRVPEAVLRERLLERGRIQGRSDDTAEVIDQRLKVYAKETHPLVAYYAAGGKLKTVDGVGSVAEIQRRIESLLGKP